MKNITIKLLDKDYKCDEINEENLEIYLSAQKEIELIGVAVVDPFENALKNEMPYGRNNVPDSKITLEKKVGKFSFKIDVIPTNKPSYAPVFGQMQSYINNLELGSKGGRRRYGVRTIEEQAYASIPDTLRVFSEYLEESAQPSVDIKLSRKKSKGDLAEKIAAVDIDVENDYSELNEANALLYINAKDIVGNIKKQVITSFQKEVKNSTGYDKDCLPEGIQYTRQVVGDVLIMTTNSPADNIKYGEVVKGMIKYLENEDLRVSEGDQLKNGDVPEIDCIKRFNGMNYLSTSVMKGRFEVLKAENTEDSIRQTTKYLRLPKDEKVVA